MVLASAAVRIGMAAELEYEVQYKGKPIGAQTVSIERPDGPTGRVRLTAQSRLAVRVLFSTYRFEDHLAAVLDGPTVIEYTYRADDNGAPTHVAGRSEGGRLLLTKDQGGKKESVTISKEQYDLNSWTMYYDPDAIFASANRALRARRVFILEEGTVAEQIVAGRGRETVEACGQTHPATRVTWTQGAYVSQTWHGTDLANLMVKYVFQDKNGETVFLLKKR